MGPERLNLISKVIVNAAYQIHTDWGPSLMESVYSITLAGEIADRGYTVDREKAVPITYRGRTFPEAYRADLIVEQSLIIEVKSVVALAPIHHKQLLTYLRLSGCKLGLLINFGGSSLKENIKRIVNGL